MAALDKTSSENSRLQLNCDKAERDAKEAKQELASKTRDLDKTDREFKALQSSYNDASGRLTNAEAELKTLRPDHTRLTKRLEDSKKSLEDETLKRVDLQNQLLSVEEQLKFENQVSSGLYYSKAAFFIQPSSFLDA